MEKKVIVANLLKNAENKQVKNLKVKSVTVTEFDNYARLGLKLDKPVTGFVDDGAGNYKLGETDVIFVSSYSIGAQLRDNDDVAFAVNTFNENPNSYAVILTGATIDIVQQSVKEGEIYINPFSSNQATDGVEPTQHDMVINHIVNIKLTDKALARIDKMADSMLGF